METSEENFEDGSITTQILLIGVLIFLGVMFVLGVIVNIPAAIIYHRSRQLRGFTDKFILFILISDIFSVFTYLPVSFISVLEILTTLNNTKQSHGSSLFDEEERPVMFDSDKFLKESQDLHASSIIGDEFSSYCVHQWIYIVQQFLFILMANLGALGAFKIAIERYLAVVAPLHYHKILKTHLIFLVSLTSFLVSIAFAVLAIMNPEDIPATQITSQCTPRFWRGSLWSTASSMSSNQIQAISTRFDYDDQVFNVDDSSALIISQSATLKESHSVTEGANLRWWPVLKLVHALVFFAVPVILMTYMYLRIWSEAKKQNARMAYNNRSTFILPTDTKKTGGISVDGVQQIFTKFKLVQRIKRKAKMDRAARVALFTIGLLTLCFGLLYFVQILMAISSLVGINLLAKIWKLNMKGTISTFLHLLPMLLASLHPVLSPLVYVYRYKRVRRELKNLLSSLIFSTNCCCNYDDEQSSACDCQAAVNQINHLAQKLPDVEVNAAAAQQITESQSSSSSSSSSVSDITIAIDLKYPNEEAETVPSDNIPQESDIEGQEYKEVLPPTEGSNKFFHLFNCWMSSYSRRWNQHRESVTSTASFITLLSTRSRSIPSTDI